MTTPFRNQAIGGTLLKRKAIQSPNYVTGVSGWTVNKDGTAEFSGLVLRGTFSGTDFILNSAGLFVYSSAPASGNLIASIAAVAGSDTFGNAYPAGITSMVPGGFLAELLTGFLLLTSKAAGTKIQVQAAVTLQDALTTTAQPGLLLLAPKTSVTNNCRIQLLNESSDTTVGAQIILDSPGSIQQSPFVKIAGSAEIDGDLDIATAGKGLRVKEGTNAKMGTAVLAAGTATVSTTAVTANSRIFVTCQALGGTAGALRVTSRIAGTSFLIVSTSGTDTSTVAWLIVEPG